MAEWLTRAAEHMARVQAADCVIPPGPGPVKPERETGQTLAELGEHIRGAAVAAQASGVPLPVRSARHFYALLNRGLRAQRGLPLVKPRRPAPRCSSRVEGFV